MSAGAVSEGLTATQRSACRIFLGAASKVAQRDGRLVEMYLFAAVVYFTISCLASFGVRRLQARIAIVR